MHLRGTHGIWSGSCEVWGEFVECKVRNEQCKVGNKGAECLMCGV